MGSDAPILPSLLMKRACVAFPTYIAYEAYQSSLYTANSFHIFSAIQRKGKRILMHPDWHASTMFCYICQFNGWARGLSDMRDNILLIRYEDMRENPKTVMEQVFDFVATPGAKEEIAQAVEFASYDNMKKLEESRFFRASGARVRPGDKKNPDSYKVRRAKIGGYRDYFDDEQVTIIDALVNEGLDPVFGYGKVKSTLDQNSKTAKGA